MIAVLGGCSLHAAPQVAAPPPNAAFMALYKAVPEERFAIPASDISRIDPQFLRTEVAYATSEQPGTIVVDTARRHLYLVLEKGRALRYGIGVGADGMKWSGRAVVGRKAEWPRWTPTLAMIKRDPERNGPWAKGMPPGLDNPLGARALYIFQNGEDTLYRLHGSPEWNSIGKSVSSGCVRLMNQDIVDLYDRVPGKAPILVTNGLMAA
jgi:lipoprotein-anchoring transpeptidase ErfK/SrfK